MKIKFSSVFEDIPEEFYPKPAQKCLPDWYKESNSYVERKSKDSIGYDSLPIKTIKKCMPIFDSITSGYIIFSAIDIKISYTEDNSIFIEWPSSFYMISNKVAVHPIQFHNSEQLEKFPFLEKDKNIAKFVNPWGIQTPKGYSVFVTTPMHRELPFEILPAIVDTDKNHAPINFPFLLKEKGWSGFISAGTPIAQVIPFKRDSWELDIGKEEDQKKVLQHIFKITSSYKSIYKHIFWNKKDFK